MEGVLEEAQVRAMFDRIAGFYDRMNTVMTAGLHHRWRRRAADLTQLAPGDRAIDVACGTGDLALELARRVGPDGLVVGADFSERMLALARAKAARRGGADAACRTGRGDCGRIDPGDRGRVDAAAVHFELANALSLPHPDNEFDAATVAFGARNFADLERGLREMVRVVRPGGRVVVLELTRPTRAPLSAFFALWFDRVVPALGRLAGDRQAYSYLPSSVRRFPGPEELARVMAACGLERVSWIVTAGGIIALHSGVVG